MRNHPNSGIRTMEETNASRATAKVVCRVWSAGRTPVTSDTNSQEVLRKRLSVVLGFF